MQRKIIIAAVVVVAAYLVYTRYIKPQDTGKGPILSPTNQTEESPSEVEMAVATEMR